jgi:hypothetical protein
MSLAMPPSFIKRNGASSEKVSGRGNDFVPACFYNRNMPAGVALDWYLPQWMAALHVRQVDLMSQTGWDKRKASFLVNGKQPYTRSEINEASAALRIAPFELLMHPDDAMALRRLRGIGLQIAAETALPWHDDQPDLAALTAEVGARYGRRPRKH